MTKDDVHLRACDFAQKCQEQITLNRMNLNEKALTHDQLQGIWLNHYDGFSAGYRTAIEEQDKERDERLSQLFAEKLTLWEERIKEMVISKFNGVQNNDNV